MNICGLSKELMPSIFEYVIMGRDVRSVVCLAETCRTFHAFISYWRKNTQVCSLSEKCIKDRFIDIWAMKQAEVQHETTDRSDDELRSEETYVDIWAILEGNHESIAMLKVISQLDELKNFNINGKEPQNQIFHKFDAVYKENKVERFRILAAWEIRNLWYLIQKIGIVFPYSVSLVKTMSEISEFCYRFERYEAIYKNALICILRHGRPEDIQAQKAFEAIVGRYLNPKSNNTKLYCLISSGIIVCIGFFIFYKDRKILDSVVKLC